MKIYINKMNQKLYLTISILHLFILHFISTDNIQNRSNWWKEVHNNSSSTVPDYVPSGTVRSLINSTISGNEYWRTNSLNRQVTNNYSEAYNEIVEPESIVLPPNTKIIRKIKRTFKNKTTKQTNDQPSEESTNEWKENFVEPSISLDHNSPIFTTSSPIVHLQKASTSNQLFQTTASDLDNLITSKVKWDDDNESVQLSRSPIFKAKIGNQESIYEKYASIMPLPPPNTQSTNQQPTTQSSSTVIMDNQYGNENSNNNLQSSSHHSVVAPLSSSNSFFNFNSRITHSQPVSRQNEGSNKNQRKKQIRNMNNKQKKIKNQSTTSAQPAPIQDFFLEADKIDKKVDDHHVNNLKKTVDFTSRVNHEVMPKNNLLAHLLKNNPFAIPIGKKTYKVTKKGTTTSATPSPTVLTKRMQPAKGSTLSYSSIGSSISRTNNDDDEYTTTPMSSLSNDNLDNINFKATPSKQEYTWGMRRIQAPKNNLIQKTNSKANQLLAKRNEWSGNDEQKDSINEKLLENTESDEESVENEESTPSNEDVESINNDVNNNDLNNEFNKNLAAIKNEESPKFDVVTFKTPNSKGNNQMKGTLNVKSLPIQIISWRQAITHRNKAKDTNDEKPFAGERITSAKLTVSNRAVVRKEQQIEREKPSPKAFINAKLQTNKQPLSTTSSRPNSSFRTTSSPKLTSTTRSSYNSATSTIGDTQQSTNKRQQPQANNGKSTRNPLNSFVALRKNEAYIAPQTQQTPTTTITKTKPAQLFQEYEDEKESFREELDDNFITNRQADLHSSPKKENRVKYAKNQEFRKKSLNLIEDKNNDNSIENNDQTEATKPIPQTSFRCTSPGYFGDLETGCTVFHICQENNRKDSFFCPPGTAFNQLLSVCDWQANVNCAETSSRSKPIANSINNNAFDTSNNLRNNNYESDDSAEEQKK